MTKPITTIAVMMLYEQGLIDLYDPVDKYLKGYANMKVATTKGLVDAKSKITIRQLLNMTSGLVYPGEASEPERIMEEIRIELHERAVGGEKFSNVDICNELGKAPLLFHPGEGWGYGISADVAAGIVEVVTGVPYGEYLKKEIFEPLDMKDTGFFVEESQIGRLATMYSRIDAQGHLRESDEKALEWLNLYAPTKPPYIESGRIILILLECLLLTAAIRGNASLEGRPWNISSRTSWTNCRWAGLILTAWRDTDTVILCVSCLSLKWRGAMEALENMAGMGCREPISW